MKILFNEEKYTPCVKKIINFYKDIFKEGLEKALEPFMEEIKKIPLEVRIIFGEL